MWKYNKRINLKHLNPFVSQLGIREADSVYSPDEFSILLGRERARSDRSQKAFALVLFRFTGEGKSDALYTYLLTTVAERIRITDEVGWFESRRLGVCLPYTGLEGARLFARNTLQKMEEITYMPECRIYVYPLHWYEEKLSDGVTLQFNLDGSIAKEESGLEPGDVKKQEQKYSEINAIPSAQEETLLATVLKEEQEESNLLQASLRPVESLSSLVNRKLPAWKRAIDIVGSLVGIILFAPFLLPAALWIKMVSKGPVFFRQERLGFNGKRFSLLKLRTMHPHKDASRHRKYMADRISGATVDQPVIKLLDPNIIALGHFIRSSCLDEIPQLFNVLIGDMSLVGPRPPIEYEVKEYLRWHASRFDTVPGMTGLWQVSGKNNLNFRDMVRLDIQYIRNQSFWLDMKILFLTPRVVIQQLVAHFFDPKN